MDDFEVNSELLGAAQRQKNLRENELTRQELAALRDDLNRREQEEKAAPKCPYCAGPITYGVEKCRHCGSDLQWVKVRNKQFPLKADADAAAFSKQKEDFFRRKDRERDRKNTERKEKRERYREWRHYARGVEKTAGLLFFGG